VGNEQCPSDDGAGRGDATALLDELERLVDKAHAFEEPFDVTRLVRLAERVDALRLRAVGEFDASGAFAADGYTSASAWLRDRCRLRHERAAHDVNLARRLRRLSLVADAFAVGDIGREHVAVLARACARGREAAILTFEEQLVNAARGMPASQLGSLVRYVSDVIDGDDGAGRDEREHQRRRFDLSRTLHGAFIGDLELHGDLGETVDRALKLQVEADRGPGDIRTPTQRRADALGAICRLYLDGGAGGSRRARPHVSVVYDIQAIERDHPALVAALRVEARDRGRLSRATLDRLSCDAEVSRVLTDGPSQVIDVGRATRTVTHAQWTALVARDRHCTAPGCDRGPSMCDAHHIVHWRHGGSTDLANLRLLCWEHHRAEHHDTAYIRRVRKRE
jgi:hypothetical protein